MTPEEQVKAFEEIIINYVSNCWKTETGEPKPIIVNEIATALQASLGVDKIKSKDAMLKADEDYHGLTCTTDEFHLYMKHLTNSLTTDIITVRER